MPIKIFYNFRNKENLNNKIKLNLIRPIVIN